jgi:hypothetical protein
MLALLTLATAVAAEPKCETTTVLTAQEGTLSDGTDSRTPNANDQDLCWSIVPPCPDDACITLSFTRMAVERSYDWNQVLDGGDVPSGKAASTSTPCTAAGFTLGFHSDQDVTDTGFSAAYSCETLDETATPTESLEPLERVTETDDGASILRRGR